MKKYLGFVFLKLDKRDIVVLLSLAIILILADLTYLKVLKLDSYTTSVWVSVFLYFIPWWFLDVRFRNILFSLIWLVLISQYCIIVHYRCAFMPLAGFFCYQITRIIFWRKNKREFIPTLMGFSHYRGKYSKILHTSSDDEDGVYSFILLFGMIILMSLLIPEHKSI